MPMTSKAALQRIAGFSAGSVVLLPAIVLFFCLNLYSQTPPYVEAFVEGGGSFITGGSGTICLVSVTPPCRTVPVAGSFSKTGRIFAGLRVRATRHYAFEFGYSFSPNHLRVTEASSPQDVGPGYNRVHNFNFNYVAYLLGRGRFEPFVSAGLVVNRFTQTSVTNGNQVGFNYGGGADISVVRNFAVRLEVRDIVAAQPAPVQGTSHDVVPSAGLVIRFK